MLDLTIPTLNQEFPHGTGFRPSGNLRWIGGYNLPPEIAMHVEIFSCDQDYPSIYIDTALKDLQGIEDKLFFSLPSSGPGGYMTEELPPGCYKLCVSSEYWGDARSENDTLCTIFTVVPSASVALTPAEQVSVSIYPNPFSAKTNIVFDLPTGGLVTLKLVDITGKSVRIIIPGIKKSNGHHELEVLSGHLEAGLYFYELTFTGTDGRVQRLAKTMAIVK
jgi:hypothetical protein